MKFIKNFVINQSNYSQGGFAMNDEDIEWIHEHILEDIKHIVEEHQGNVFGLQMWTWNRVNGNKLTEISPEDIDFIFKLEDETQVYELIKNYQRSNKARINQFDLIHKLSELAIYHCSWEF